MEIEGFREKLQKRKAKELKSYNPNFSGPEASASAAIEVLHSIAGKLTVKESQGEILDEKLVEEIDKRVAIVRESPAYKRAEQKEMERLGI